MGDLYWDDILIWSERQADLLRRLAAGERVNDAVDWENVIDEVETVGRSEFKGVQRLLEVGLTHLLLMFASHDAQPVPHWRLEVLAALRHAAGDVTPGMRPRIDLARIWRDARAMAGQKLSIMGGAAQPLPETCPFTVAELLNPDPDPDALLARLASNE